MKLKPREYQQAAHDAIFAPWIAGVPAGNPACELATGLGKSILVAMSCMTIMQRWPKARVQMLVHNRELVRQNYEELKELWPEAPVGIYSAGLNSRDTHQPIIFSSIQSVYNKVDMMGPRHFNLCDECHLIPVDGDGMYQQYFRAMEMETGGRMRTIGFTATPYRMDSGGIADDSKQEKLFDKVAYRYGIGEGTRDGWLAPLTARQGATEIDVDNVQRRGGEFVAGALQAAANEETLVARTVEDIIMRGRANNRRSWLVFCSGVAHAEAVAEAFNVRGVTARAIHGKMGKSERDHLIEQFKIGQIQVLTNAEVLTTGFNAPAVDLIALLRPTLSTALFVQMMGRGTRTLKSIGKELNSVATAEERRALIAASAKPNCLVLDYAGNVRRFGPVDMVGVDEKKGRQDEDTEVLEKVKHDDIRAKQCPDCGALVWSAAVSCGECGYEFEELGNHEDTPDEDIAVLSDEIEPEDMPVLDWSAAIHRKPGSPDMLKISYRAGVNVYDEYWCLEHRGRAKHLAYMNWMRHTGGSSPPPATAEEALERFHELVMPRTIRPVRDGKFFKVTRKNFAGEDFRADVNVDGLNREDWEVPRGRFPGQQTDF